MPNQTPNELRRNPLRLTWLPVRDEHGRTRMEARWTTEPHPAPAAAPHAA